MPPNGVVFLKPAVPPGGGTGGPRPGIAGAAAEGGLGGADGGLGAEATSESDRYEESALAPVSTPPPRFFSLGIPPAKSPPNCGAGSAVAVPWSLLLLARFPGTDGARPGTGGAPPIFGTGGAPPTAGAAEELDSLPTCGAERSLVTAFLRALPL